MRVLYCALGHDYGDPTRGPGYERMNFEDTLRRMPLEMIHFDFAQEILRLGYWGANCRLKELVSQWKPDVMFCVMFEEQMSRSVIADVSHNTPTTTVGWFCADHCRFESYSRHWASAFNWVVTTDYHAVAKYHGVGQSQVILSQWACNHHLYHPVVTGRSYDVSFVGQPHGARSATLSFLRRHGVDVECWGQGWPNGRVSHDEMLEIFSASKVCLNLSASSASRGRLQSSLMGRRVPSQIKGRVFEVPGCGALLLTEWAPGIEDFYVPGREIIVFRTRSELLRLVRELLSDDERRNQVAQAGYGRTLREHTYEKRLTEVFRRIGLDV